jgi:hypothetical protein
MWCVELELAVVDDVPVSADPCIVALPPDVLAVAGAGAGATAAVPAVAPCGQPVAIGGPPRLPPRIALPVAVQPAPGVDVGGFAVVCASATPPAASAAAAARLVNHIFLFMRDSLDGEWTWQPCATPAKVPPAAEPLVPAPSPSDVGRQAAARALSSYEPARRRRIALHSP